MKLVLVYEQDFEKNLVNNGNTNLQIISDASDPNLAVILVNYAKSIINDFNQTNNAQIGIQPKSRMFCFSAAMYVC